MTGEPPKPTVQHTIEQYEAIRPFAKLMGLFSKDLGRKLAEVDQKFESLRVIQKDSDLFAKIYGPLGWVKYDRLSTEITARVVKMTEHEGEAAPTEHHLDSLNLRSLGHRFNASHYRAWGDVYERAVERAGAQDYLSAVPLILSIIGFIPTKVPKVPQDFRHRVDAASFSARRLPPNAGAVQADGFGGRIPIESFSFSSEKSYSPSMLTCAHDMGE